MTGLTVGLGVGIPVFVFVCIIGVFIIRAYRKTKKEDETENDNDPDFYGETTILPDYPRKNMHQFNSSDINNDSGSLYSAQNPFGSENNRYPSGAFNARNPSGVNSVMYSTGAPSMQTVQAEPYYEGFSLPYQHSTGSKHSLDEYTRQMGSEYKAYQLANTNTPSAIPSRPQSPGYLSSNSSRLDISKRDTRNLTEKLSNEDPTTDSSNSYPGVNYQREYQFRGSEECPTEGKGERVEYQDGRPVSRYDDAQQYPEEEEDVFADPLARRVDEDAKRQSTLSFMANEPEELNHRSQEYLQTEEVNQGKNVAFTTLDPEIHEVERQPGDEEEEDEDIKRMKSVYRVYFDRENSIKSKKSFHMEDDAPPLPEIKNDSVSQEEKPAEWDEEFHPQAESTMEEHAEKQMESAEHAVDELVEDSLEEQDQVPESNTLGVNKAKKHRAVSSVYSTIPLQFGQQPSDQPSYDQGYYQQRSQQYPQYPQQYQQSAQQFQKFPPQPPQHIYQPPYQRTYSASSASRVQPEEPLGQVPTPNKIDYNSIVSDTQYAPTKSLTGGTRPPNLTVKPFNPIHYSDQIFSPTSPSAPSSPQLNPMAPNQQLRDVAPPSPHHIRQSIVMVNPMEIGKQKIYRPAGSFSQMNSANSSRAGSLTSQTAYNPVQQHADTRLPSSGSQADLRKQLGSSDNYNFV
jgi:hypothetical protein